MTPVMFARRPFARLCAVVAFAALVCAPSRAFAQSLETFAALGGAAVTCTDSFVSGDVGVVSSAPTAFTNTRCTINGTVYAGDAVAAAAYADFLDAYADLAATPCQYTLAGNLAGLVLPPGVYCVAAASTTTDGVLTLMGSASDTWIFKIGTGGTGALTGTNFSVVMPGGAAGCDNNVFWWVSQAATLTDSIFLGNIFAGTSITVTGGSFDGQALAHAAVTLTDTDIGVCGSPSSHPGIKVTGGGQIAVPNVGSAGRETFGFNAQPTGTGEKGQFNYLNHVTGLHINGDVTSIEVIAVYPDGSPKTVRFSGTCGKGSPACAFSVTVEDHGEPGTSDQFGIVVTGGVTEVRSQRVISRGNIQFHK